MSEKMRGALFSALGDIEDLTVLDAFAGSGALAIEAISRGAKHATAIDVDKNAQAVIENNAKKLSIDDRIKAIRANINSWSDNNPDTKFNLIFADPSYDKFQLAVLQKLTRHLAEDGVYVLSWPGKMEPPQLEGLQIRDTKNYGDSQLIFY
jgi:16S rRNA (guanine966-N2)-methyltransferase